MIKKNYMAFFILLLILIIILSFKFDNELIYAFSLLKSSLLDKFFLMINNISSRLIIFLFLTTIFFIGKKSRIMKRRWILPLWFTLILSSLINFFIKILIKRPRPYTLGLISIPESLIEASHSVWNFSFPSSHAMMVFAVLPILNKEFHKFKYVWIVFAVLVSISRVYLGLHY